MNTGPGLLQNRVVFSDVLSGQININTIFRDKIIGFLNQKLNMLINIRSRAFTVENMCDLHLVCKS